MFSHKKNYSLFAQTKKILLIIYGLFVISFTVIFLFLNINMRSNLYDTHHKAINYCLSEIENNLKIASRSVLSALYNDPDLSQLSYSDNKLAISISESSFQRTISSYLLCYSTVDGLFFYSERNDRFISTARESDSPFPTYFRDTLRSVDYSSFYKEIPTKYDRYVFCQVDGRYCLVRFFTFNNKIGGVWINLDTILKKLEQSSSGDILLAFHNTAGEDSLIATHETDIDTMRYLLEKDAKIIKYAGNRYLKFQINPSFCHETLLILMSYSQMQQSLDLHYMLQGIFIIVLTLCFFITFVLFRNRLQIPIRELYRISATVKNSWDPETIKQQAVSNCKEIQEINEEFIRILEHIDSLENQVLKEQLLKKEYELLSLRNQVSPHFLINCLSVISSMVGTSVSPALLKSMVSTLAGHLRYTLSSKPFVSLAEEMHFVRNYYDLNSFRYPDSLTYQIEIKDLCDNAAVFPCLILMLSENSIKHNLSTDEKLNLAISAHEEKDENGRTYVHIRHLDSGNGFPEQMLKDLNRPNPSIQEIAEGSRIGLYNIKRRLLLSYDLQGKIHFSNNLETGGAQVDIIIPYVSFPDT